MLSMLRTLGMLGALTPRSRQFRPTRGWAPTGSSGTPEIRYSCRRPGRGGGVAVGGGEVAMDGGGVDGGGVR